MEKTMRAYAIWNGEWSRIPEQPQRQETDTIWVMTEDEWAEAKEWNKCFCIRPAFLDYHYCTMQNCGDYFFLRMEIPNKRMEQENFRFDCYTDGKLLLILCNHEEINIILERVIKKKHSQGDSLCFFFFDFLLFFLHEDLIYLQALENEGSKMEEAVLKGYCTEFNRRLLPIKKKLSQFYRYYNQLVELGQQFMDLNQDLIPDAQEELERYQNRVNMLAQETQFLREYVMQIQEVYQSEIEIRQNNVMKMLTIVTTIFLPLTLIAGWYGMNFEHMPELSSVYGYPIVIGVSILIVIACLIYFRKKRFW